MVRFNIIPTKQIIDKSRVSFDLARNLLQTFIIVIFMNETIKVPSVHI